MGRVSNARVAFVLNSRGLWAEKGVSFALGRRIDTNVGDQVRRERKGEDLLKGSHGYRG